MMNVSQGFGEVQEPYLQAKEHKCESIFSGVGNFSKMYANSWVIYINEWMLIVNSKFKLGHIMD